MAEIKIVCEVPMGHRLMTHGGKCRFPHGHNYLFEVLVRGPVNDHGMVLDFSDLKGKVNQLLRQFDHAMVLWKGDPFVNILKAAANNGLSSVTRLSGEVVVSVESVPSKVVVIDAHPTAENIAALVQAEIKKNFSWNANVGVWETRDGYANANAAYGDVPPQIVEVW